MPDDQKAGPSGASDAGDGADKTAQAGAQGDLLAGGDAGEKETPEQELERLRRAHEQSLGEKSKLEAVTKQLEEFKAREAARAAVTPAITPANADVYAQQRLHQMQQALANAQLLAQQGDPLAQLILEQDRIYGQQLGAVRLEAEANKVPEAYREDVRRELATGKYADAQAALKAVRAEKDIPARDQEIERLKRENESLKRADDARKAGVVGAGRPVPDLSRSRGAEPRNETEVNEELKRLEREGDWKARTELSRRYRSGELNYQRAG